MAPANPMKVNLSGSAEAAESKSHYFCCRLHNTYRAGPYQLRLPSSVLHVMVWWWWWWWWCDCILLTTPRPTERSPPHTPQVHINPLPNLFGKGFISGVVNYWEGGIVKSKEILPPVPFSWEDKKWATLD